MTKILQCSALAAVAALAVSAAGAGARSPQGDTTPPDYRLHLRSVRVDTDGDRRVKFAITCNETEERCIGTLRLRTESSDPLKLGHRMFDIAPGERRRVPLTLTRRAAGRLERLMARDRARLRAIAQSYDTFGNRARRAVVFTAIPGG